MLHNLSETNSLVSVFVSELRNTAIQQDRMRFRRNLERLGEVFAYEISKSMQYEMQEVETPLGTAEMMLPKEQPVLATILRAGLPLHQGMLNYFDRADNAFISAYRKHDKGGDFTIKLEYMSSPELDGRTLILTDPMLATGASIVISLRELLETGKPASIHIVTAIANHEGIDYVRRHVDECHIWAAAVDAELTAKGYIVPGLGDAGDLSFGEKMQY